MFKYSFTIERSAPVKIKKWTIADFPVLRRNSSNVWEFRFYFDIFIEKPQVVYLHQNTFKYELKCNL